MYKTHMVEQGGAARPLQMELHSTIMTGTQSCQATPGSGKEHSGNINGGLTPRRVPDRIQQMEGTRDAGQELCRPLPILCGVAKLGESAQARKAGRFQLRLCMLNKCRKEAFFGGVSLIRLTAFRCLFVHLIYKNLNPKPVHRLQLRIGQGWCGGHTQEFFVEVIIYLPVPLSNLADSRMLTVLAFVFWYLC